MAKNLTEAMHMPLVHDPSEDDATDYRDLARRLAGTLRIVKNALENEHVAREPSDLEKAFVVTIGDPISYILNGAEVVLAEARAAGVIK